MGVKIRELRPGKWYVVIDYRGIRKTKLVGSKERAEEVARALKSALEIHGPEAFQMLRSSAEKRQISGLQTFGAYVARWEKQLASADLKETTRASYLSNLKHHLVPAFGPTAIKDITYSSIKQFLIDKASATDRKDGKEAGAGYRKDTLRLMLATLRVIICEALEDGIIDSNPITQRLTRYYSGAPKRQEKIDTFSLDELHAIEEKATGRYRELYEFVLCLARTGMRFGEARALQWSDVDFRQRQIHIVRNWPATSRCVTLPKTSSSARVVDMSDELGAALVALRTARKAQCLASGSPEIPEWVFCGDSGKIIDYSNFNHRGWTKILELAKVRRRNIDTLRHTYATQLLAAGVPITYVSAQLGHANPSVTLRLYARWVPTESRAAVNLLDLNTQTERKQEKNEEAKAARKKSQSIKNKWSQRSGLNRRPTDYESVTPEITIHTKPHKLKLIARVCRHVQITFCTCPHN